MKKFIGAICLIAAVFAAGVFSSQIHANAEPLSVFGTAVMAENAQYKLLRLAADLSDLNITQAQKAELRAILRNYYPEAKPLISELRGIQKQLRETIQSPVFDETRIREIVRQRARVAEDLAVLRGKVSHEVRKIFSPEQKKQIQDIVQKLESHFDELPNIIEERLNP